MSCYSGASTTTTTNTTNLCQLLFNIANYNSCLLPSIFFFVPLFGLHLVFSIFISILLIFPVVYNVLVI
ncbi:uncharacterized protein V1516DRAFT_482412 [Lipomyces oligophaga]|uniref:uncharacterized protein n=1 Tax=Lipomyces oligophaga TaxID=45792 RepID=UPI0034CE8BB7